MKKKKLPLPPAQLTILRMLQDIAEEGDMETPTVSELAELCNLGPTWTHLCLNSLEQGGYIKRSKQWRSLQVTRKGKNLLRKNPYKITS